MKKQIKIKNDESSYLFSSDYMDGDKKRVLEVKLVIRFYSETYHITPCFGLKHFDFSNTSLSLTERRKIILRLILKAHSFASYKLNESKYKKLINKEQEND